MKNYPIVFSQRDSRWSDIQLGNTAGSTIGDFGCYDTSFAIKACYYGKNTNPAQLNADFKAGNVYVSGDNLTDNALQVVYGDVQYIGSDHYENIPADMQKLKSYMSDNTITVTICIAVGTGYHFVEVVDCDGNTVTIANPWTGQIENFTTLYGDPVKNILRFIIYKGPYSAPVLTITIPQTLYESLVNKATQWDKIANNFKIDPADNSGGSKAVALVLKLQDDLKNANNSVSNLSASLLKCQSDLAIAQELANQVQGLKDQIVGLNIQNSYLTDSNQKLQGQINDLMIKNGVLEEQNTQLQKNTRPKGALGGLLYDLALKLG